MPDEIYKVMLIGGAGLDDMLSDRKMPDILFGIEISWDRQIGSWRADWEGGVQFGQSKHQAIINGLKQRLGVEGE